MRDDSHTPATHSNFRRQQGPRCASLWLLAPTTGTSVHPVLGLSFAPARSCALPSTPGLKPADKALPRPPKPGIQYLNPGDDEYARKKGIGCVGRTEEARETGTFPILRFSHSPYLLYLSAAPRRSRSGGAVFFGLVMFSMH